MFAAVGIVNALIWHSFTAYLAVLSWFFVYVLVLFVRLISDLTGSTPERDSDRGGREEGSAKWRGYGR